MPFAATPQTFHGGCNCHAIRYRITLPPFDLRAKSPYDLRAKSPYDPDNKSTNPLDLNLPMSLLCHCNDCRRANGQLVSSAIANELSTVQLLLAPRSTPALSAAEAGEFARLSVGERDDADEERAGKVGAAWVDAGSLFGRCEGALVDLTGDMEERERERESKGEVESVGLVTESKAVPVMDTWLRTFRSSYNKTRAFCGRCGTPLFYFLTWEEGKGYPDPWPTQLDVWTGTVDRVDLEREEFRPVREVWLDFGIEWMGGLVGGAGVRKCRTWK